MRLTAQLLLLVETYCRAINRSEARVSTLIFNSGDKFKRLRSGKGMLSDNVEDAIAWFSDRWPEGVAWPEPVTRPAPVPSASETRTAPDSGSSPASQEGCGSGGVEAPGARPADPL